MTKKENLDDATAIAKTVETGFIIWALFILLFAVLFIWALIVSISFPLPKNIKVLCIVLTLLGFPFISLPLAYGFKGKQ